MESASLAHIRYCELKSGSLTERQRLFQACRDDGFFYLDYGELAQDLTSVVQQIYRLQRQLFGLSDAEKLSYDIDELSPRKLNGSAST